MVARKWVLRVCLILVSVLSLPSVTSYASASALSTVSSRALASQVLPATLLCLVGPQGQKVCQVGKRSFSMQSNAKALRARARRLGRQCSVYPPLPASKEYVIARERIASASTIQKALEACEQGNGPSEGTSLFRQYWRTEQALATHAEKMLHEEHRPDAKELYQLYQEAEKLSAVRRASIKADSEEGFAKLESDLEEGIFDKKLTDSEQIAELSREVVTATGTYVFRAPIYFVRLVWACGRWMTFRYQVAKSDAAYWQAKLNGIKDAPAGKAGKSGKEGASSEASTKGQEQPVSSIYDI